MNPSKKEITHLRQLLAQQKDNINYLEKQAVDYGATAVPLELHNRLVAEHEAAETTQLKLDHLLNQRPVKFQGAGTRIIPLSETVDAPNILIIEDDIHWRAILVEIATALGAKTTEKPLTDLIQRDHPMSLDGYSAAVISLPIEGYFADQSGLALLIAGIIKINRTLPSILLTSRDALSIALAARKAMLEHNLESVATIQKETFSYNWFTRMLKKTLTAAQSLTRS